MVTRSWSSLSPLPHNRKQSVRLVPTQPNHLTHLSPPLFSSSWLALLGLRYPRVPFWANAPLRYARTSCASDFRRSIRALTFRAPNSTARSVFVFISALAMFPLLRYLCVRAAVRACVMRLASQHTSLAAVFCSLGSPMVCTAPSP
jgi:hypothetical protein